jgi:transposase
MKLYIGIDWSQQKHDICILNEAGAILKSWQIAHSQSGFAEIIAATRELSIVPEECFIGIETAYNLVMDFLSGWGYPQLYVLPPSAVKAGRQRYRQAPARTDQSDAWLIANLLRVDLEQYHCWLPNSELTMQIGAQVNLILKLTRQALRYTNQLQATLLRYYPAVLHTFHELDSLTALNFITSYPNPTAARALSQSEFEAFARKNRFTPPLRIAQAYLRLQAPQPVTPPATAASCQPVALQLVDLLKHLLGVKKASLDYLNQLYAQHPDQPIYASLPGAGLFLEPALLSKLGDQRSRFPTPQALQATAGTCPVTERSGKMRHVLFRTACDHHFRYIVQEWARGSIRCSSWARLYFSQVYEHCNSKSHAYRCLANRWLAILWRLWQDRCIYDETVHLRNRMLRAQPPVIEP